MQVCIICNQINKDYPNNCEWCFNNTKIIECDLCNRAYKHINYMRNCFYENENMKICNWCVSSSHNVKVIPPWKLKGTFENYGIYTILYGCSNGVHETRRHINCTIKITTPYTLPHYENYYKMYPQLSIIEYKSNCTWRDAYRCFMMFDNINSSVYTALLCIRQITHVPHDIKKIIVILIMSEMFKEYCNDNTTTTWI